ncbi:hypothetical protein COCNU_07G012180 [Cocos nucifera]|uniref:Uncharacterized protein n=1 Tax=Cocos nucifera TaxID=13894 RepID=A0A8K0IFW4_COCNU|nr:hypothetical protein COCNU_07G012180 [Cocos nucifera]
MPGVGLTKAALAVVSQARCPLRAFLLLLTRFSRVLRGMLFTHFSCFSLLWLPPPLLDLIFRVRLSHLTSEDLFGFKNVRLRELGCFFFF